MADHTVAENLYLTVDDKVVKEGDPRAVRHLFRAGKVIPAEEAQRYGLVKAAKQADAPANKAKKAPANKKG